MPDRPREPSSHFRLSSCESSDEPVAIPFEIWSRIKHPCHRRIAPRPAASQEQVGRKSTPMLLQSVGTSTSDPFGTVQQGSNRPSLSRSSAPSTPSLPRSTQSGSSCSGLNRPTTTRIPRETNESQNQADQQRTRNVHLQGQVGTQKQSRVN